MPSQRQQMGLQEGVDVCFFLLSMLVEGDCHVDHQHQGIYLETTSTAPPVSH